MNRCGFVLLQAAKKLRTVFLWLLVLLLTTLFTLLFIMCFIHFLKNNHSPPIVPNDLQDFSTTKSLYFILSFYFLLWTVVYIGTTISTLIPRKSTATNGEKPGKALLFVLLILLAIITLLLCTVDRFYSPWIGNFVRGKIFSYCVQVSSLITATAGTCYLIVLLAMGIFSGKKKPADGGHTHSHLREEKVEKSYSNPCYNYNIEFLWEESVSGTSEGNEGVTQV